LVWSGAVGGGGRAGAARAPPPPGGGRGFWVAMGGKRGMGTRSMDGIRMGSGYLLGEVEA